MDGTDISRMTVDGNQLTVLRHVDSLYHRKTEATSYLLTVVSYVIHQLLGVYQRYQCHPYFDSHHLCTANQSILVVSVQILCSIKMVGINTEL